MDSDRIRGLLKEEIIFRSAAVGHRFPAGGEASENLQAGKTK